VKLHHDEYVASSSPVQPDAPGVSVERKLVKSDLERILDLLSHLTRDHTPQPPILTTTSTLYSDEALHIRVQPRRRSYPAIAEPVSGVAAALAS